MRHGFNIFFLWGQGLTFGSGGCLVLSKVRITFFEVGGAGIEYCP